MLAIPIKRSDAGVTCFCRDARVSEALDVDASDLQLDRPRQVLLRGKGRKQRMVPMADDLTKTLEALLREQGIGPRRSVKFPHVWSLQNPPVSDRRLSGP